MASFSVDLVRDAADPVAGSAPVEWAVDRLRAAVARRGGSVRSRAHPSDGAPDPDVVVIAAGRESRAAAEVVRAGIALDGAEALALWGGAEGPVVLGSDARGLSYGIVELAERVEHGDDPIDAFRIETPIAERPANEVRSVARSFCSEVEDKPWFHDEAFWSRYLSMLASNRFNRFSLTLGLGYNYPRNVSDAYLYFAYPFLLRVPGHDVRVPQLADEERQRNLAALRFISEQAVARGLDFQLGLWTHAYEWIDSPDAHHTIEGLTPETHAAYCRDAVAELLDACPAIGGLTFRIHGESGVPEGSWEFWRIVFEGVAAAGRRVRIDLHAKGLDARTLGDALATGLPVTVSPKFWAEHMGLPYHQAAIRENERLPRPDPSHLSEWHRAMNVSEGSRPFTRYGYADFLREGRPYGIVYRLWAGTQRVLLWGDPAFAAGYGRAAALAESQGLEWCEPLTFKGREGSGVEGSRTGYADPALVPRDDWEKFAHAYRLFGRLTYDPDASPEAWRRPLRARFGRAAADAEVALACASRILPLVTVAHHPSASNNYYWPELYTDMPIVWSEEGTRPHPYLDTPQPRRFGTVDPLDPEVFSSVVDHVAELRAGVSSGRLSPLDVAAHLERLAREASTRAAGLEERAPEPADPEVRRWSIDIAIVAALGRFFSGKLRAAVAYELHAATGQADALRSAITAYRAALAAWREASARAGGVYVDDLTYGPQPRLRGHWRDRIAAIESDLRDMERRWPGEVGPRRDDAASDVRAERARPPTEPVLVHDPPPAFEARADLRLVVDVRGDVDIEGVVVRYRPMNHALPFGTTEMEREDERFVATVPGAALDGRHPVAYAFVARDRTGSAWRFPALRPDLSGQPYFVLRCGARRAEG